MDGEIRTARLRVVDGGRSRTSADELLRESARTMADYLARRLPEVDPADPALGSARRLIIQLRAAAGQ